MQNLGVSVANSGLNAGIGNVSDSDADVDQNAELPADVHRHRRHRQLRHGLQQLGRHRLRSPPATPRPPATTRKTTIGQTIDPTGLIIPTQLANVTNAGVGIANSGGNVAVGNASTNYAEIEDQSAEIGENAQPSDLIIAGTLVASNNGEASNASDGTASIAHRQRHRRPATTATPGSSRAPTAAIDGAGFILNTQVAAVQNVGVGIANSGINIAVGQHLRQRRRRRGPDRRDRLGQRGIDGDLIVAAGIITAANNGTASNSLRRQRLHLHRQRRGLAATERQTHLRQTEGGTISGLGGVINTQAADVVNVGVGVGNSGLNLAVGNASNNDADLTQRARIASDNGGNTDDLTVLGTFITATNNGTASNTSDGTANVTTGDADGHRQRLPDRAHPGHRRRRLRPRPGAQHAGGRGRQHRPRGRQQRRQLRRRQHLDNGDGRTAGAGLDQEAEIASDNVFGPAGDVDLVAFGPITAVNSGEASNTSDGQADVITGGAQGQGNVSATFLNQDPDSSIDGAGFVARHPDRRRGQRRGGRRQQRRQRCHRQRLRPARPAPGPGPERRRRPGRPSRLGQ